MPDVGVREENSIQRPPSTVTPSLQIRYLGDDVGGGVYQEQRIAAPDSASADPASTDPDRRDTLTQGGIGEGSPAAILAAAQMRKPRILRCAQDFYFDARRLPLRADEGEARGQCKERSPVERERFGEASHCPVVANLLPLY